MEVLQKTQFAQFEKDYAKLPEFLKKKFEEAVIANSKKSDAERVNQKLQKAEKKLQEQKELQEMKRIQKRLNYEENLERGRQARLNKNDYYNQVMAHKKMVADQLYAEQLSIKINKAQTLGTQKVQEAKSAREQEEERRLQRIKSQKLIINYPNVSVENARVERQNKLVYKHYNILKNVHTRQFHSQRESTKKKENLETKLAKAEQRKQEIINEKIAKAVKAASKKDYGIVRESLEEKLARKQNKAEENRKIIIQGKIDKAASLARLSTVSSASSQKNENQDTENLKVAQSELKACYGIINAQKEANYKMLQEMTELKKQMEDLKKQNSYASKKPIAFTIGEVVPKRFANFDPVQTESQKKQSEEQSWMLI